MNPQCPSKTHTCAVSRFEVLHSIEMKPTGGSNLSPLVQTRAHPNACQKYPPFPGGPFPGKPCLKDVWEPSFEVSVCQIACSSLSLLGCQKHAWEFLEYDKSGCYFEDDVYYYIPHAWQAKISIRRIKDLGLEASGSLQGAQGIIAPFK